MAGLIDARRRSVRVLAGVATVAVLFAACSSGTASTAPSAAAESAAPASAPPASAAAESAAPAALGATTIRSNENDDGPGRAVKAMVDYCTTKTGVTAPVTITNHKTSRTRSARTCRARLTTSSSGSPATASASSPARAC